MLGSRAKLREVDDDSEGEENDKKKKPEKSLKYMKKQDIVGQEASFVEYEEGMKIEPFNMNEELEEGFLSSFLFPLSSFLFPLSSFLFPLLFSLFRMGASGSKVQRSDFSEREKEMSRNSLASYSKKRSTQVLVGSPVNTIARRSTSDDGMPPEEEFLPSFVALLVNYIQTNTKQKTKKQKKKKTNPKASIFPKSSVI